MFNVLTVHCKKMSIQCLSNWYHIRASSWRQRQMSWRWTTTFRLISTLIHDRFVEMLTFCGGSCDWWYWVRIEFPLISHLKSALLIQILDPLCNDSLCFPVHCLSSLFFFNFPLQNLAPFGPLYKYSSLHSCDCPASFWVDCLVDLISIWFPMVICTVNIRLQPVQ